jgi:FMN phosphatase YigB (HAD superfamily)
MRAAQPDPLAYATVEQETGHAGERILFFDDRTANVAAARSLGWTAEQIDHTGDTAAQLLGLLRRHGVTS